jgi:hypothetical protein
MKADRRLNANEGRKMAGEQWQEREQHWQQPQEQRCPPPVFFLLSEYERLLYQQQSIYINFFNKL